jgi:hypothetical protein
MEKKKPVGQHRGRYHAASTSDEIGLVIYYHPEEKFKASKNK